MAFLSLFRVLFFKEKRHKNVDFKPFSTYLRLFLMMRKMGELRDGSGSICLTGESVHVRWSYEGDPNIYEADPAVITLAPVAPATYQPLIY